MPFLAAAPTFTPPNCDSLHLLPCTSTASSPSTKWPAPSTSSTIGLRFTPCSFFLLLSSTTVLTMRVSFAIPPTRSRASLCFLIWARMEVSIWIVAGLGIYIETTPLNVFSSLFHSRFPPCFSLFILHSARKGPSEGALERQGLHPGHGAIHTGRGRVRRDFLVPPL